MRRVLVLGAGPAGLAAAARLVAEAPGRVRVEVLHQGHHHGGKAASYVDGHGRQVEHGWHMVLGFYRRMRRLLGRAGIDLERTLRSMGGRSWCHEPGRLPALHPIDSSGGRLSVALGFAGYGGLDLPDRLAFGRFMAETFARATSPEPIVRHDDLCFSTFAVENGLRPHLVRTRLFRLFREAYFNYPEEISAYHVLKTMQLMASSEDAEASVCRGPWSEYVWDRLAAWLVASGVSFQPHTHATDFLYSGRAITGVRVARPDPAGHDHGKRPWGPGPIPLLAGSERTVDGFDFVISTIPVAVLQTMNARDERWWGSGYFSRLRALRSASTVAMRVVAGAPRFPVTGPVFGLPPPLGIGVNMTSLLDPRPELDGCVVDFVGQEAGFEAHPDDELAERTLRSFAALGPDFDLAGAGIRSLELHRNRADAERLFLAEPGVQELRPGPRTPFRNLFLAGDFVRNEVDVICMEGAIAAGEAAADEVLGRLAT